MIVPTYNERDSIAEVARRLFDAAGDSVELLVVDDGSPDGTAAFVKELAAESP
ncbi:MAG TPA: glycosyltransferase, partial [Actinomycetota bacterium]|nr:glycosyltransferase [Actinomycetota bacterium]